MGIRFQDITAFTVLLGLLLASAACEPSSPEAPIDEFPPDDDLPQAVVDLPAPPPDSAFEIQQTNDDGSLRVEGLVGHRDQYFDSDVEVRGVIAEIIGDDCDPSHPQIDSCPTLHLEIRDHIDDSLGLYVVGFDDAFLRRARLREGQEYLFSGTYTDMAHDFPSTRDGLIDLHSVDDHDVPRDD